MPYVQADPDLDPARPWTVATSRNTAVVGVLAVALLQPVAGAEFSYQPLYKREQATDLAGRAYVQILGEQWLEAGLIHPFGQAAQLRKIRQPVAQAGSAKTAVEFIEDVAPTPQGQDVTRRQHQLVAAGLMVGAGSDPFARVGR